MDSIVGAMAGGREGPEAEYIDGLRYEYQGQNDGKQKKIVG